MGFRRPAGGHGCRGLDPSARRTDRRGASVHPGSGGSRGPAGSGLLPARHPGGRAYPAKGIPAGAGGSARAAVPNQFRASWCEACTGEAEGIDQLRQRLAGHGGLDVLAVATFDSREKALASDKILPMTWPVVIDADGGVAEAYGVAGLPQSFIVDDKGQILLHIRGKVAGEKLNKISRLLLAAEGAR